MIKKVFFALIAILVIAAAGFAVYYFVTQEQERYFTVSVEQSEGGTLTASPYGKVHEGEKISVTAVPDAGYETLFLYVNGKQAAFEDGKYTIESIDCDITLRAVFSEINYNYKVIAEGSGDAAFGEKTGDEVTFYARPAAHWLIGSLALDGEEAALSDSQRETGYSGSVTAYSDHELAVVFVPAEYTVTVNDPLFIVSADKTSGIYGDKIVLSADLPEGGKIISVTVNGEEVKDRFSSGKYEFTLTGDTVVEAVIDCETHSVDVVCDRGVADYNLSSSVTYDGGSVTIEVFPATGYRIMSLSVNGEYCIFDGESYTVENVTSDIVIEVTSEKIRYDVSVTSSPGGKIMPSRDSFYYGDKVAFYIMPDSGYELVSFTVNGEEIQTDGSGYTAENFAEDLTVAAVFGKQRYTIVTARSEGGTIVADSDSYTIGDRVLFTLTPYSGYMTGEVTVNGNKIDVQGNQFALPDGTTGNVTVYVRFDKIRYTLTVTAEGGGKAESSAKTFTVTDKVTVDVIPDEGFDAAAEINGVPVEIKDGKITIEGFTSDADVKVTFTRREYRVTVKCGEGGKVTAIPLGAVKHGEKVTVLIDPDEGYRVLYVTVNGVRTDAGESGIIVENITEDTVVAVQFEAVRYSVIIRSTPGGEVRADKQQFIKGESVTFEFIPDEKFKIGSVSVGGMPVTSQVEDGKLTLTGGAEDMVLSVVFVSPDTEMFKCTTTLDASVGSVIFTSDEVPEGGSAAFMVRLNEGYKTEKVTVDGKQIKPSGEIYTLDDVRADVVVNVEYSLIKYAVTVADGQNAVITAPDGYTIEDTVVFIVEDKPGYKCESLTVGDVTIEVKNGRAEYSGFGDVTVTANCVYGRYEVAAENGRGYTITVSGREAGLDLPVTLNVKAETGYRISAIVINGKSVPFGGGEYLLEGVDRDTRVTAAVTLISYDITIVNYLDGKKTEEAGAVRADRTAYTAEDVVKFTVVQNDGYYLRSVTVQGVNYTDRIENGAFTYSGTGGIIVVANFAADGITLSGTVKDAASGENVSGAAVEVAGRRFTTDNAGRFSAQLANGSYTVSVSKTGYKYGESRIVGGENQTISAVFYVADSVFAGAADDGNADFSYDFISLSENITVYGKTPAMTFGSSNGGNFAVKFTAENDNDAATDYEKEPGIGIQIKCGDNRFTCQFVAKRARIIINDDWTRVVNGPDMPYYDFNVIGEKHDLAFVKSGDTVIFLAKADSGEYKTVFTYSDERLGGACEYSFYVTKRTSVQTLKMNFTQFNSYYSLAALPQQFKGGINIINSQGGDIYAESFDDGLIIGKDYRIYAVPRSGMKLDELYVDGVAYGFESDGAGGGYIFLTAGENATVSASFVPEEEGAVSVSDGTGYSRYNYDGTLYYRNDLITDGADPGVIYVSEEEDPVYGGWFYMTVTSSRSYKASWNGTYYDNVAYLCYRSRDLSSWETAGAIDGYALGIKPGEWANDCFWAPEMLRDPETGKYFLYFSARSKVGNGDNYSSSEAMALNGSDRWDRLYLGIAMSDSPVGPYSLVSARDYNQARGISGKDTNAYGEVIDGEVVPVNFAKHISAVTERGYDFWPAIDVSPFRDDDGQLYLYFSQHMSSVSYGNVIWVMKMKDLITPDYSTMTMVAVPGYSGVTSVGKGDDIYFNNGSTNYGSKYGFTRYSYDGDAYGNGINEGVNVIKDPQSGKYFLTYSPFGYGSRRYSIMQAVSDSPMGPFEKLPAGVANPVLGIYNKNDSVDYSMSTDYSASIDYIAGTGHHCFVRAGNELFTVYHAFFNPVNNNNSSGGFIGRRIAADRVFFTYNEQVGHNVLYGNGPTDTLQAMPAVSSGYENIASDASITAAGAESDTVKYLSDGLFVMHKGYSDREFTAAGQTEIKMTFQSPRTVRSVMVYSAAEYGYALKRIGSMTLVLADGNKITFDNLELNSEYYDAQHRTMHYGGAIIADFDALEVKEIIISADSGDKLDTGNHTIKISDIVVLGKTENSAGADSARYSSSGGAANVDSVRIDGKPFDYIWENADVFVAETGGTRYEVMAARGTEGVYFLATAYVDAVYHAGNDGNTYKYAGLRRFYKNTGWTLRLYAGNDEYSSDRAVTITADAYSFIIDGGKVADVAVYVNGTVNAVTESFSIEAYLPYPDGEKNAANVAAYVRFNKASSASASSAAGINVCQNNGGVIEFDI